MKNFIFFYYQTIKYTNINMGSFESCLYEKKIRKKLVMQTSSFSKFQNGNNKALSRSYFFSVDYFIKLLVLIEESWFYYLANNFALLVITIAMVKKSQTVLLNTILLPVKQIYFFSTDLSTIAFTRQIVASGYSHSRGHQGRITRMFKLLSNWKDKSFSSQDVIQKDIYSAQLC